VATVHLGVPWIGATEDSNDTDAVFTWFAPTAWGFTAFAPGEPDDDAAFGGNGECLAMVNASGEWGDTNCDFVGYVDGRVCEFPANGCGDGLMVAGEACDDGNTASSDGCSSTCTVEPGATCSGNKPTTCSKLVINEIDYDNPGTDTAEFVEIFNAGTAAANLTDVALVLINAGTLAEYFFDSSIGSANVAKRILLTGAALPGNSLPVGGYLVITSANVVLPPTAFRYNVLSTSGSLQNGNPDAVVLFRLGASPAVIDALSYEGTTSPSAINGVTGTWSVTEGSGHPSLDAATGAESLCRIPNGRDTQNNSTDFQVRTTMTPGAANN
jgi:cysteine-rich repeat protein